MAKDSYLSDEIYSKKLKRIARQSLASMAVGAALVIIPMSLEDYNPFIKHHPIYGQQIQECSSLEKISKSLLDAKMEYFNLNGRFPPSITNESDSYILFAEDCRNNLEILKEIKPEVKEQEEIREITRYAQAGAMFFGSLLFTFGIMGNIRKKELRERTFNRLAKDKPLSEWPEELP